MVVNTSTLQFLDRTRKIPLLIFAGMLAGQILFLAAVLLVHSQGFATNPDLSEIFLILAGLYSLGAIAAGFLFYSSRIKATSTLASEELRFRSMLSAMIVRLALLEGANMLNIAAFLITGDRQFLIFVVLIGGLFLMARPTSEVFEDVVVRGFNAGTGDGRPIT